MREVAERAGVAISSVSRVLNDHPDVSPRMRAAVMRAVAELGYRPDMLAQALRSGRTLTVGFTVSDISNHVLSEIVIGAEKRLRVSGYAMLLTNSEGAPELDAEHLRLLERRRVDGLILALADERYAETVEVMRGLTVPLVLMDRDAPAGVSASRVLADHAAGMRAAATHLLELGHRDVALIVGGPSRPARERRQAVEEAIERLGGGARMHLFSGGFGVEHGARATREVLALRPRPTAIVAGGNMLMAGALLALREAGVVLGRELSFVGCDDQLVAALHRPPIAIVTRDVHRMGVAAAELLLAEMGEPEALTATRGASTIVLGTEFLPAASCGPVEG